MKVNLILTSICISIMFLTYSCEKDDTSVQENESLVQENENLARSFIELLSVHDIDSLISLFVDNCLYEEVATGRSYQSKSGIASYLESTISGIPDSEFIITSIFSNEQFAAVEWIWKGTNSVGWPSMGIPATNEYFELRGISILEIENKLISRTSDYWDWDSFMKGIGVN